MCAEPSLHFPWLYRENAIQNNFQRVTPLPDGSVCKFPAIAVETEPSNLTAPFVYQRLCDTQVQKGGNIVLFMCYGQRNAPNRRPYRPKAIYVRGKEVHEQLLFQRYGREKGPYRRMALSGAKRVYVRISTIVSIKACLSVWRSQRTKRAK